jgi:mRNA interferase MazF
MAAKVRPCLVLSIPTDPQDRVLVTVVPHTTSVQGTRFEVAASAKFLKPGVFDAQQIATVAQTRLVRRLGRLGSAELASVEAAVRRWLELPEVVSPPPVLPVSPPPPP